MPRIHFQQQLVTLKDKLLAMAALAEQCLQVSVEAYVTRNYSLCQHVFEIESAINAAERSVDEMAYELLAKEQPMAVDLRFILSVIKINGDLERVGDQATNIAERTEAMQMQTCIDLPVDIKTMGATAGTMIRSAIRALLEADAGRAEEVLEMDDAMDAMNREAQQKLLTVMQEQPACSDQALSAILIARNLERAADHATNIAEDVIFWVRGSDVRHKMSLAQAE